MVDSGGDVSMDNLSFSPEIENRRSHARTTPNLWDQALQKLDHIDRQRVDLTRVDHRAVLDDLLKLVAEKQRISVERQWKYTKRNGEVVPIRDAFQNVVNWVKKFREVGDAVAQYDPAHLSLPWAGIRLLLQLAINDSETYGAIVEGVELVSSLVAQYAKVEELYLHSMLAQQQQLEKSITELYMGILSYLSKAMQYYDEGRAGRMAKSLVRGSSSVDKWTKIIVDRAAKVDAIARIIDADFTRKIARFMYGEFQGIHTRFDGLENRLDGLQLGFRMPFPKPTVGLEQVMIWLNPVFAEEEYEMASRLRTPDTCQWIFQRAQYLEWTSPSQNVENPSKTFWVHGPPGFGKTVLCANIVQRLKDDHANSVAYFFCTSDDAIKRQPLAIVRAWVAQMVRQDPIALEVAEDVCRGKDRQPPTTNDIWLMFGEICKSIPNCFFVVDGFDECVKTTRNTKILAHDEGAQFLRELSDASTFTSAHILFVSREDNDLRRHFRKLVDSNPGSVVEYEISPYDTRFDLQAYSTSVVSYTLSKKSVEFQAEMVEEASRRSQGMFLWVRLLGSRLSGGQNAKKLREIIKKTPPSLEKQYDRDLQRIENLGEERERAIAILRWTLFAHRPLTVRELTEALTIDLDDDSDAFPKDDLPDTWEEDEVNDEIRRLCGSLIELRCDNQGGLPQNQTVHFVHSSVRDYLMRSSNTDLSFQAQGVEEDLLARICLRFLMCVHFGNDFTEDDELGHEMFNEYKFLEYASRSWYLHARSTMDWSSSLLQSAVKFFEPSAGRWLPWSKIFKVEDVVVDKNLVVPPPDLRYLSSLFFTSLLGLEHCVQHLLLLQDRAQNADQDASTPLHAASAIGHREIVQLLIQHGATIDAKVKEGWTPLHSAVWNGHFEVVRLLLEQGADIAATDQDGRTPLHSAAYQGHLEVVRLLLEQGADIAATDQDGRTPLHSAAYQGHLEVVRLLLEQGADIAATDQDGRTPLRLAANQGHLEVVKLLLEQGADIAATDQDRRTPLHSAAYQGHLKVVRLLLEQGADIAATDQDGRTPLHLAAYQGHLEVVRLLLEQGADIAATDQDGRTPLHSAAYQGHLEVVRLLLEQGADIAATDQDGWTPLHLATYQGHLEVVRLLLEQGADIAATDQDGWTPLHLATYQGHLEVVRLLLEQGADIAATDQDGRTPLHSAAYQGHLEVVRLLLEQGDDIAATDQDGWTPLRSATYQGHLDVIKLLIEQGAELNARNQHGQTLLHLAAESNHIEVLNFLITPNIIRGGTHRSNDLSSESRVDVNVQDAFGRTPLHLALYRGCSEAALALAEHGVDLSLVDGYGRNALEWDSVCEGPLGSTAKWSSIHVLTPECVRVKSLQKSVFLISKELLKSEERPIFPGFHELAHCLMFLNEADDARFCFQRQLIMAEDGSLVHGVYCNACANSPMVGSRFVCKMCPDVDLCDACMRRPIEDRPQTCSKHEFFEISQPIPHSSKVGSTDESREGVLAWLRQIVSRYGDGGY